MRRVRSQDRLQGFDPDPERTFYRRLREARDMNNIQAPAQFPMDMEEEQPMAVQEVVMPSFANVTSSRVKPRITGHFELKQSMIQLLHANMQFMDYVRLTLFPFSLLGKAKRWLKAEPTNSITTWNDLARKFLARFFPSSKTAKIRSEIVAFKQKAGESLYSAWERFKGLLRDCPHHNQTNEVLSHTFIEGLCPQTKIVVDTAAGGQVLEKRFDEIYALLNKFSKSNSDWQGEMGRNMVQKSPWILKLDVVSALAENTRPIGALPSDTKPNPKAQVNAVTLRNGRSLEEVPKKKKNIAHPEGQLVPQPVEGNKKDDKGPKPVSETRPPPPFPQRLQKQKDDAKYKKFLDILSEVSVNLPLVEILQEAPKYARYLRDIVAKKRRHAEFEIVALTEECSAIVQSKLPPKLKDPGCFTIPLSLGKQEVGRALCDLGASINLMPSSLFKQLGFGVLRPNTITLQLADRSLVMPEGIIEDVLVRVGKFILPADFIVLDYEADEEVPIILGRPFLATGGAFIDVREGKLKMRVDDEEVTFNVYKALKLPKHYEDLCMITVVELKGIEQSHHVNHSDPDGTTELEEVVFPAEHVKMIEKRARDKRGDLPRACKKARLYGRKKKKKLPT
ncbi:uncharacterized protein [Nicotiana sylvestris]|uniref:uncharacterized protein n=1 Tax=Nicotiana sylvestris TaxID=4096 RepID=UPI00388CBD08